MLKHLSIASIVGSVGYLMYSILPDAFANIIKQYPWYFLALNMAASYAVYRMMFFAVFGQRGNVDPAGKAVLITGCDSGFGNMLAERLYKLGYTVFAGCLAPDRDGALKLKNHKSSRIHVIQLDVTDDFHVQKAVTYVTEQLGDHELWALVNNAGLGLVSEIEWCSVDQFQRILDVNVMGVVRMTKAFLPLLRHAKGRVVNVASLAGRLTLPMYAAYSMSKKAVVAFTDSLRQEMRKFDVNVISVEPGLYKTPISTADSYISWNRRSWSETPKDVKEDYGEEYFQAAMKNIKDSMERARPHIHEVVEHMEMAVVSRSPQHRYVPNLATYIRSQILTFLPSSLTDRIFAAASPRVKPQLIVRQESQRSMNKDD